jgi:hypothetical protein
MRHDDKTSYDEDALQTLYPSDHEGKKRLGRI